MPMPRLTPLQDCLRDLVLPVMQKVHDKVNFTLSFIGKYVMAYLSPPDPADPRQADGQR
jgi:hypothetical protein